MAGKKAPLVKTCPDVFNAISETRTGYSFWDLSTHSFSATEKLFLCQQIRNGGTLLPYYEELLCNHGINRILLLKRHCLSTNMIKKWLLRYDKGLALYACTGSPPANDAELVTNVQARVQSLESNRDEINSVQRVTEIMNEELHAMYKRRGRVADDYMRVQKKIKLLDGDNITTSRLIPVKDVTVCTSTMKKLFELTSIHGRSGQPLSEARLIALHDIRVVYKVACAWLAFAGNNSAQYKWNFDCTTLIVSQLDSGKLRLVVRERGQADPKVEATHINSSLNILIKVPVLGSSAGEIGPLVTITAIPTMPEDVFFKYTVPGLTHSAGVGDRDGYILL